MRHDSWQPFPVPREQEPLSFYCWSITLPNTRNWGIGIWGKYFDETRRDKHIFGGRVLRTGVSCKSQVAGEQEQEYSARPQICHSRGRTPVRGIRPFLLGVEARRSGQRQLARRAFLSENQGTKSISIRHNGDNGASTSEGGENNGRGLRKIGTQRKLIKR